MICRLESQKGREIPAGIVVVQITEILRQGISGLRKGDEILLCGFGLGVAKRKSARTEQVAEKVSLVVIPNEVRNPSVLETQEKRDSSARSVPRNDNVLSFSATCEVCATKTIDLQSSKSWRNTGCEGSRLPSMTVTTRASYALVASDRMV